MDPAILLFESPVIVWIVFVGGVREKYRHAEAMTAHAVVVDAVVAVR